LTVNPQPAITVDSVYYLDGAADVQIPLPHVNGGTVNTIVDVAGDTTTMPGTSSSSIQYGGESGDVANNTGGKLSQPVACIGDLTLVT